MKITWHGHSCFTIASSAGTVVLDPYEDGRVPGYAPLRLVADGVLCSHGHADHAAAHLVGLTGKRDRYQVERLDTFHDDVEGAKRGKNLIHILSAEGLRVAHLGDLGCEPTPAQLDALRGLDALMIPVGGFYTIDAGQAKALIDRIEPAVVLPMHYRVGSLGYEVIGELSAFLSLCGDVVRYEHNGIELKKGMPRQTAVLCYEG